MARFVRNGEIFDVWVDRDGRLCVRDGGGPVEVRRTPPGSWVTAGIREIMITRFDAGWRRVRDPAHEPDFDDEPREPRFEAALAADPDDDAAALVYADWYQQQDHPRGDLIAVQCALGTRPDADLRAREAALFRDWGEHLVGGLAGPSFELAWRNGFVRRARIVGHSSFGEHDDLMWELLRHPSTRFLHTLELAGDWYFGAELAMAYLVTTEPAPPLRVLHVLDTWCRPSLTRLLARYPQLEDVTVSSMLDEDIPMLPLHRFALRTDTCVQRDHLRQLAAIRWPELEELEVRFVGSDDDYDRTDCTADDVATLLAAHTPKLATLRLTNAPFADALAELLVQSPRSASLEVIDLSRGALTDAGATTLAAGRASFPRLRTLHVDGCPLTAEGRTRLAAARFNVG